MKKPVGRPRSSLAAADVKVANADEAMEHFRAGLKKALSADQKRASAQDEMPEQKRKG